MVTQCVRLLAAATLLALASWGGAKAESVINTAVSYRTETVDGINIFYREAGPSAAPTVVLLHGFPSSSHMFRDLIPKLATRYHVVAPDYPGFGYSEAPSQDRFNPTFANLTRVMGHFIAQRGIKRATFYLQDFGGPVGFRLAVEHPEWIQALVVQNANAYDEGLAPRIKAGNEARRQNPTPVDGMGFELGSGLTDLLYKHGATDPQKISPDSYTFDLWAMAQPEHKRIAAALLNDYHSNSDAYPDWQASLRKHQPPTLIVWGRGDPIFLVPGVEAFRRDLKHLEIRYFDTSHFALEEESGPIAAAMLKFLDATVRP